MSVILSQDTPPLTAPAGPSTPLFGRSTAPFEPSTPHPLTPEHCSCRRRRLCCRLTMKPPSCCPRCNNYNKIDKRLMPLNHPVFRIPQSQLVFFVLRDASVGFALSAAAISVSIPLRNHPFRQRTVPLVSPPRPVVYLPIAPEPVVLQWPIAPSRPVSRPPTGFS